VDRASYLYIYVYIYTSLSLSLSIYIHVCVRVFVCLAVVRAPLSRTHPTPCPTTRTHAAWAPALPYTPASKPCSGSSAQREVAIFEDSRKDLYDLCSNEGQKQTKSLPPNHLRSSWSKFRLADAMRVSHTPRSSCSLATFPATSQKYIRIEMTA